MTSFKQYLAIHLTPLFKTWIHSHSKPLVVPLLLSPSSHMRKKPVRKKGHARSRGWEACVLLTPRISCGYLFLAGFFHVLLNRLKKEGLLIVFCHTVNRHSIRPQWECGSCPDHITPIRLSSSTIVKSPF